MICCSSYRGGINNVECDGILRALDSLLLQTEPINVEGSEMLAEEVHRAIFTAPVHFVEHVSLLPENVFCAIIDNLENPIDDKFSTQDYSQMIQDLRMIQKPLCQERIKKIIQALELALSKSWSLEKKAFDYFYKHNEAINDFNLLDCRLFFSGKLDTPKECFSSWELETVIADSKEGEATFGVKRSILAEEMYEQIIVIDSPIEKELLLDYSIVKEPPKKKWRKRATDYQMKISSCFVIRGKKYVCIKLVPYNKYVCANTYFIGFDDTDTPNSIKNVGRFVRKAFHALQT